MDIFLLVLKGVGDSHPDYLRNINKEIHKKKKVEPQISELE